MTTWYNVHCKHTLFFEFLGLLNEFFFEEAWIWGVRVGFGGREGALASALIKKNIKKKIKKKKIKKLDTLVLLFDPRSVTEQYVKIKSNRYQMSLV